MLPDSIVPIDIQNSRFIGFVPDPAVNSQRHDEEVRIHLSCKGNSCCLKLLQLSHQKENVAIVRKGVKMFATRMKCFVTDLTEAIESFLEEANNFYQQEGTEYN